MRANISGKLPHVFRFRRSKIMPEDCEVAKKFLKNLQKLAKMEVVLRVSK